MIDARVPRPAPDCTLERLQNEALLFCPSTASTLFLNETAVLVWDLCDAERSATEIADLLCAAYPEAAAHIAADVERAIHRFIECGAIRFD